jgi:hypothetical protein
MAFIDVIDPRAPDPNGRQPFRSRPPRLLDQSLHITLVSHTRASGSRRAIPLERLECLRFLIGEIDGQHLSEQLALVSAFPFGQALELTRRIRRDRDG